MGMHPRANGFPILLLVIGWVGCIGVAQAAPAADDFTGYWRTNGSDGYVLEIKRGDDGRYICRYGFAGAGVWGRFTGELKDGALVGVYKSHDSTGDMKIAPGKEAGQAQMHYRTSTSQRPAGIFDGVIPFRRVEPGAGLTLFEPNPKEQAWRHSVIEKFVKQAMEEKVDLDRWSRMSMQIRGQIESVGRWPRGWPLPRRIREIGWTLPEIGWVEVYFLQASTWASRDRSAPKSTGTHHRFIDPASEPRAGGIDRHFSSYRRANEAMLDRFFKETSRQTAMSAERRVRLYFAMWDYLTVNESRGVIARPVFDLPSATQVRLYNDSHQPVKGTYTIEVYDGERKIGAGTGQVEIPAYEEKPVEVTFDTNYTFFNCDVRLDFMPEGYERKPIPKDKVKPFFEAKEEYIKLVGTESAEIDFLVAVLWARVEKAWNENDRERYARAVRDAGARLYLDAEKSERVRQWVRGYLEAVEQPDVEADAIAALPTGPAEIKLKYDAARSGLVLTAARRVPRMAPKVLAAPEDHLTDAEKRRITRDGTEAEALEPKMETVTVKASIEDGRLVLDTSDYSFAFTGYVTLYDGRVALGTYGLDTVLYPTAHSVAFAAPPRTVSFYQPAPSYKLELTLYHHAPPARGEKMNWDMWHAINKITPGILPLPRR